MNSAEQNKSLYQRFLQEVFNEGRVERIAEFLSPDYVLRDAPPGSPAGPDSVKRWTESCRS